MNGPNVERRDSGPVHMDRTSDEYFEPELTDAEVDAQDSLFDVLPPAKEQQLRGWE